MKLYLTCVKFKIINFDAVNNSFTDVSAMLPSSGYKTI